MNPKIHQLGAGDVPFLVGAGSLATASGQTLVGLCMAVAALWASATGWERLKLEMSAAALKAREVAIREAEAALKAREVAIREAEAALKAPDHARTHPDSQAVEWSPPLPPESV